MTETEKNEREEAIKASVVFICIVVLVLAWATMAFGQARPRAGIAESSDRDERVTGMTDKEYSGYKLFHDPRLSKNGKVSCATCHDADKGFTAGGMVIGLDGKPLARKPLSLLNVSFYKSHFADGRAESLEAQARAVLTNKQEMGNDDVAEPAKRVGLDEKELLSALAAYVRTIKSEPTRFEKHIRGEDKAFTASESRGWNLYRGKASCYRCHTDKSPFTDNDFHNTGIGAVRRDGHLMMDDVGRAHITNKETDIGKFKTPQLRGVKNSGPYFHDGSAKTLEEVVEMYDRGMTKNKYLDKFIFPLHLTTQEKQDLVRFLKTL